MSYYGQFDHDWPYFIKWHHGQMTMVPFNKTWSTMVKMTIVDNGIWWSTMVVDGHWQSTIVIDGQPW